MNIFISVILFIHGIAHLVGFVLPWKIATLKGLHYKTTLLNGKLDLGETGIKIVGVIWLIVALLFFCCAFLLIIGNPLWFTFTVFNILFSIILCVLGFPDSKMGILANILLILILFILISIDWIILN